MHFLFPAPSWPSSLPPAAAGVLGTPPGLHCLPTGTLSGGSDAAEIAFGLLPLGWGAARGKPLSCSWGVTWKYELQSVPFHRGTKVDTKDSFVHTGKFYDSCLPSCPCVTGVPGTTRVQACALEISSCAQADQVVGQGRAQEEALPVMSLCSQCMLGRAQSGTPGVPKLH